ncbi:hypothetical protein BMI79_20610 [Serratia oryzae]|uniref:Plasmid stabilization protein n=1 Tax=Serratia oryzae TaxID=2034155 RepID=A0A1S8CDW1_9GAMM|nr:hypothetical protein BMI79_20610 [Serratia oryzae]VXC98329.1 conserved hypothetical protein [Enterobacterales bacterium 8AC]
MCELPCLPAGFFKGILRIQEIIQAISVLEHNLLIGRVVNKGMRELVIGYQTRGYVALYRYIPNIDTALVLAIRSQRELGYYYTQNTSSCL